MDSPYSSMTEVAAKKIKGRRKDFGGKGGRKNAGLDMKASLLFIAALFTAPNQATEISKQHGCQK